jgi:hypothetical protein
VRLASNKSDCGFLRQPRVFDFKFRKGLPRAERNNAIDVYFLTNFPPPSKRQGERL